MCSFPNKYTEEIIWMRMNGDFPASFPQKINHVLCTYSIVVV